MPIAIDDAGGVSHARSELCAAAARYVMNDSAAGFVERIPGGDVGGYRRASGARFTLGEGPTGRGALAASHGREAIARQLARTSGLVTALLNLSAVRPEHGAAARRAAVGGCVDAVAAEIRAARGLAARAAPFTGAALRAAVARLGVAVVALLAAFQHAVTAAQARHDGRFHDGALRDHLIRIAALAAGTRLAGTTRAIGVNRTRAWHRLLEVIVEACFDFVEPRIDLRRRHGKVAVVEVPVRSDEHFAHVERGRARLRHRGRIEPGHGLGIGRSVHVQAAPQPECVEVSLLAVKASGTARA